MKLRGKVNNTMFLNKNDTKIKKYSEITIDENLNLESHVEKICRIRKYKLCTLRRFDEIRNCIIC